MQLSDNKFTCVCVFVDTEHPIFFLILYIIISLSLAAFVGGIVYTLAALIIVTR